MGGLVRASQGGEKREGFNLPGLILLSANHARDFVVDKLDLVYNLLQILCPAIIIYRNYLIIHRSN